MGGDKFHKKIIMRFLEYLFFKYYYFQVKVGNEDIAPISSILFISFIIEFVYADILCFCFYYIPYFKNLSMPSVISFILVYIFCFLILFYLIIYKNKYKAILIDHEAEWKGSKNLGAILFAVIPFIVFFIEMFFKIKINRSVL